MGVPSAAARPSRWAERTLRRMSLRDKAAQMVWPQLFGDYVAADDPQWQRLAGYVTREHVGGFIISIGSPLETAAKLNALQQLSPLPLLVSADYEAGAGFRARGGWFVPNGIDLGGAVLFPQQMALGATRDSALAYAQGRVTAREGRALGVHVAFAPVLDVNNNPANPVINTRSLGGDPALVARLGAALVRGIQDNGMVATGKHFPGHGDTDVNSHLALPVVSASRARLDSVELVPFRAAIAAGVGAIMTMHGVMPALDSSGVPGTLSPRVVTELLRGELGFDGLAVSDAMDMRGVLALFGPAEATKRAVAAGLDILIQPADVAQTIDAIVAGVREGRYSEARLDQSVRRILATKARLGLDRRRTVPLERIPGTVGDTAHVALARTVAERSVTLVRDSLGQVPMAAARGTRVLSVTYARRADLAAGSVLDATLRAGGAVVRSSFVEEGAPASGFAAALAQADSAAVVLVGSYVGWSSAASTISAPPAFVAFVRALEERGRRPILLAFGNPYLLQQLPEVPAYLVGWGGAPVSQAAVARALLGLAPITGRLPIEIPPVAAFGAGLQRPAVQAAAGG